MHPAQVILLGPVSRTLAPGMRLGWVVPPGLLHAIAETKRDDDFGTGVIEQHALASWLESEHYHQHVRHVRRPHVARQTRRRRTRAAASSARVTVRWARANRSNWLPVIGPAISASPASVPGVAILVSARILAAPGAQRFLGTVTNGDTRP